MIIQIKIGQDSWASLDLIHSFDNQIHSFVENFVNNYDYSEFSKVSLAELDGVIKSLKKMLHRVRMEFKTSF